MSESRGFYFVHLVIPWSRGSLAVLSHQRDLFATMSDEQKIKTWPTRSGRRCNRRTPEETNMSPTIRSLVIPVSDLDAAKAVYTALLGAPHTDQPYYVGYNVDGFEVGLAPGDVAGGPVAYVDVEDLD